MSIVILLIPLGLLLLGIAVWAFLWAVDHDQFEDLDRAGQSILFDDDVSPDGSAAGGATRESRSATRDEPSAG